MYRLHGVGCIREKVATWNQSVCPSSPVLVCAHTVLEKHGVYTWIVQGGANLGTLTIGNMIP